MAPAPAVTLPTNPAATPDAAGARVGNAGNSHPPPSHPLLRLACIWIIGTALGLAWDHVLPWLLIAAAPLAMMVLMALRRRPRGVRTWALLALIPLAGAWSAVRLAYVPSDHLLHFVTDQPQLADITGVIEGPPHASQPPAGAFAIYGHREGTTLAVLRVQTLLVADQRRSVSGHLLLRLPDLDDRLQSGATIAALGWLGPIAPPSNPGETDFHQLLARRDIAGELRLHDHDNLRLIAPPPRFGSLLDLRTRCARAAAQSLRLGMPDNPTRVSFLDAILLGHHDWRLLEVQDSFRRSGVMYLLAISGVHLGIVLGLAWLLARAATSRPPLAALVVLLALALYLLIMPTQVSIMRCAVAAGAFALAYASARRAAAIDVLGLAAILVLLWRPDDLAGPGFQLSFGVAGAMILWTGDLAARLAPPPLIPKPAWRRTLRRRAAQYLAVNLIGFGVSLPIVAWHFGVISPAGLPASLVALPLTTLLLAVGYFKIIIGLILPSAGMLLAYPTQWSADTVTGILAHFARIPGACLELPAPPPLLWVVLTLLVVAAALSRHWRPHPRTGAGALALCALWLILACYPGLIPAGPASPPDPAALRLNMFSVGNGSAYLVRLAPQSPPPARLPLMPGPPVPASVPLASGPPVPGSIVPPTPTALASILWSRPPQPYILMFDCGAGGFLDVGNSTLIPALRTLGITHIDTIFISHSDLDHICGTLDLADHIPIGRILVTPQFADLAQQGLPDWTAFQSRSASDDPAPPPPAATFLMQGLRQRHIPIEIVARGWHERLGCADAELLWPPPDYRPPTPHDTNDTCLVLSLRAAGRRLLLNGDIQQRAMLGMFDLHTDLSADVTDLPHHGSFVSASPRWLAQVAPTIVLQSCAPSRLRPGSDRWRDVLVNTSITRLITARLGMVELAIDRAGHIAWHGFRQNPQPETAR